MVHGHNYLAMVLKLPSKHPLSTHGAEGVWVNKTYGVGVSVGVRDL